MPSVEIPGHGAVEFPDTMSNEDIAKAINTSGALGPGIKNPIQDSRPNLQEVPEETMGGAALKNLPGSAVKLARTAVMASPGMLGYQLLDSIRAGNPIEQLKDTAKDIYHTYRHPAESFASDPIGTGLAFAPLPGGAGKAAEIAPKLARGAKFGAREGMSQATLTRHGGFGRSMAALASSGVAHMMGLPWWPSMEIGLGAGATYPVVKGAIKGAINEAFPKPVAGAEFKVLPRNNPSIGGRSIIPQDTGIEGGVVPEQMSVEPYHNFSPYQELTPRSVGGRSIEPTPTSIQGGWPTPEPVEPKNLNREPLWKSIKVNPEPPKPKWEPQAPEKKIIKVNPEPDYKPIKKDNFTERMERYGEERATNTINKDKDIIQALKNSEVPKEQVTPEFLSEFIKGIRHPKNPARAKYRGSYSDPVRFQELMDLWTD